MKAIILAGGLSTRLKPLTDNVPKPLLKILDKPFLLYQIELLKKHSISEVIISTHYFHHKIKDFLKDGSEFGVKITYSYEEEPLGTAGAIKLTEKYLDSDSIIVLNGDILTDLNLTDFINYHHKSNADITLNLTKVLDPTSYGLVFIDESLRITKFLEKPSIEEAIINTVNTGIYIINCDILKYIPENTNYSIERQLFHDLIKKDKFLNGYISDNYWLDIGTIERFNQATLDIVSGKVNL